MVWASLSCDILCCATKIVNRQMSVHFKRNSCDIMVSQRCCVLSDGIWTYFCHFLYCSHAKFIKKIVDVWTLVAQQLFAWPRHVLCRTTFLYKVVWLNSCSCGRTLRVVQELKLSDYPKMVLFCRWLLKNCAPNKVRCDNFFFSDKPWFTVDEYVNLQNYRVWLTKRLHAYIDRGLYPEKIGVWYDVSQKRMMEQYSSKKLPTVIFIVLLFLNL